MQKIKDYIYFNRKELIFSFIIICLILVIIFDKVNKEEIVEENIIIEEKEEREIEIEEVKKVIVDIKGEVKNPGIYELDEGKRIIDVIKESGGITEKANTKNINLSEKITDEMLIIIPSIEQEPNNQEIEISKEEKKKDTKDNKISINTATIEELMTINGIGKTKAKNIIEYRNSNGKFKTIEDIKNVSGIGDSTFEKIKNYIKV